MKKCVLINCFNFSNEMRVEPIRDHFTKKGYETIYLGSDFHHAKKEYEQLPKDVTPIHVSRYKKNLSIERLISHYQFAKSVGKRIEEEKPDVIYIKFPPNSLVKEVFEYKKHYKCKVILDIFDLWPESLPIPKKIKRIITPVTNVWKSMRDDYLNVADIILTECNMYASQLKNQLPIEAKTLYLFKNDIDAFSIELNAPGIVNICYLGGINNLLDFSSIKTVLKLFVSVAKVTLHIIGDGENKEKLICLCHEIGCTVADHGLIYSDAIKHTILKKCDFGLNLMKDNVMVGLSLKSIEYFRSGLAVINNLPYDTWKLIDDNYAGINFSVQSISIKINSISPEIIALMRRNSRKIYELYFSRKVVVMNLDAIFSDL